MGAPSNPEPTRTPLPTPGTPQSPALSPPRSRDPLLTSTESAAVSLPRGPCHRPVLTATSLTALPPPCATFRAGRAQPSGPARRLRGPASDGVHSGKARGSSSRGDPRRRRRPSLNLAPWRQSPPRGPPPGRPRPAGGAQAAATGPRGSGREPAGGATPDCGPPGRFPAGAAPAPRCNPSRRRLPRAPRGPGPARAAPCGPAPDSESAMGRGACVPPEASGPVQGRRLGAVLGALCLVPALALLVRLGTPVAPAPSATQGDVAAPAPAARAPAPPAPPAPRRRRYTLTPARLRWDHFNLTYRILSFPRNLLSPRDTRRGLAAAFRMWSDVSPFSFREVAPEQPSDLRIGFYAVNHTDCLVSALHHCFDGPTGELAHAFFPPHGGIHFDDSEHWVLGPTRYSWKKGVWLTDLVHVAAHEIGHALGLMHSQHGRALMHLNATLRGWKALSQDELWGLHRLYGCLDRLFVCASWARRGFCDSRQRLMKRLCPSSCDFCYAFPFPTAAATLPPPRTKTRLVPEGRNVTFRCGHKILHKKAGTRTGSPWSSPTPATWRWARRTSASSPTPSTRAPTRAWCGGASACSPPTPGASA
ncbi:matrix metalloproteinase-23 isoform X2 [Oryctolagus cuniculus]|uniref:matrix metalloproteinase-23 isoform X2 n=1 Tax=Oryctolagus cuniculus TaxID=9986 RepID=UPI002231A37B|nr:matrix metalloproteinase-23 isoform X2 [Oryctolagus cuniculus]